MILLLIKKNLYLSKSIWIPADTNESTGHDGEVPEQNSAISHGNVAARLKNRKAYLDWYFFEEKKSKKTHIYQRIDDGWNESEGQASLEPLSFIIIIII